MPLRWLKARYSQAGGQGGGAPPRRRRPVPHITPEAGAVAAWCRGSRAQLVACLAGPSAPSKQVLRIA